ncbi:MAG TPA: DUF1788 domain-containing protein [Atribacterota bacterium]|nr:DUF1788 domain-containing protein [Atribacterota bacterium]
MNKKITVARFKDLYEKFKTQDFLTSRCTGNEIPFYIFAYEAQLEYFVSDEIKMLEKRLLKDGISILNINLYSLCIEILKERKLLDLFIKKEPEFTKDKLMENLKGALDAETKIGPAIEKKVKDSSKNLLFITGTGLVYPYIRVHNLLNNLQSRVKDIPVVIFYPGIYTGQSLSLFGKIKAENYYRAFNLA